MRLIDGDRLKELYEGFEGSKVLCEVVLLNIDDQPTVDAVVHGVWIDDGTRRFGVPKPFSIKCSVCNSSQGASWMNYCPNCGAKMDGDIDG